MALREGEVTFLIYFRQRGYPERGEWGKILILLDHPRLAGLPKKKGWGGLSKKEGVTFLSFEEGFIPQCTL